MSLINTRLNSFRATAPVDKWETRSSRYGALDLFRNQTLDPMGIITEDLKKKAIAAIGSTLEIPVIDYDSGTTIQNVTQPLVIVGDPSTSQLYAISFTNHYFGFLIHPAQHFNNEISMQREFNEQYNKYLVKLMDDLDASAVAALETGKTQVLSDDLGGRYSLVANTVVAPLAEQDSVIGDINPLMAGNDYYDMMHIVGNPSLESHVRNRLIEKGQYNTEDKTYQYNDKTFHFTNNLSNAAGHKASGYAVQRASVGLLQQFSPDCILGHAAKDGHEWNIEQVPLLGLPTGTYTYEGAVNGSTLAGAATTHLTATKAEAYGFHFAMAFITPYNSDPTTNASSIMKVAIANA